MPQASDSTQRSQRALLYIGLAVIAVVLAAIAGVILWASGDDDNTIAGDDTTTTTADTTITTAPVTTTTSEPEATTTSGITPVDTRTAVFPFAEDSLRFDDPMEAVEAFAERYLGFVDPVYSEFRQGVVPPARSVSAPRRTGPKPPYWFASWATMGGGS